MSQTSIIAGALIIAYIVFVTVRGELPVWLALLGIGPGGIIQTPSGCGSGGITGTGGPTGVVTSILNNIPPIQVDLPPPEPV